MLRRTLPTLSLVSLLAAGCAQEDTSAATSAAAPTEAEAPALAEVEVTELASLLESRAAVAVDANNPGTRERYGVIPDARLLSSSSGYELAELPSDKSTTLVFYCANTHCTASDNAAERAKEAGYADVRVLRAGITGWRDAGKPTVPARS